MIDSYITLSQMLLTSKLLKILVLLFTLIVLQRRRSLPPERTKVLVERSMREQAELLSVYEGRLLGTASWRRMIGHPESVVLCFSFVRFT